MRCRIARLLAVATGVVVFALSALFAWLQQG